MPMEKIAEDLRDVVLIEDKLPIPHFDQPLMERPGVHQLSGEGRKLEINMPSTAFGLPNEVVGLGEVLQNVRHKQDITGPIGERHLHGIRLDDRGDVSDIGISLEVVEGILVDDESGVPEWDGAGSDLDDEI
jgi:hypothetical protein